MNVFFFLMIRRPPRSTLDRSSAASDVYKRQKHHELQVQIEFQNTMGLFQMHLNKVLILKHDFHLEVKFHLDLSKLLGNLIF